ncbi:MAG: hypothetical protein MUF54_24565, partial [Polyangiaceae bacterium]|nr:hypothetical protein [Polyangiaceae bacterium]
FGPDACILEGTGLLRTHECGAPGACELQAQRWISRCGEAYATPLIVLMLTRTIQRRFSEAPNGGKHRVEFDTRSCSRLGEWVFKHVGCDGEQACAEGARAGDAYLDRCVQPTAPVPLKLALAIADVRVGTRRAVDPIRVEPLDRSLGDDSFPLQLDDNKGIVALVCGMRPKTVADYLDIRRACASGEMIVVRLDDKYHVRKVSIPHDDETSFQRLFPLLMVAGEQQARALAGIEQFRLQVAEAVEDAGSSAPEQGIAKLTAAVVPRAWDVARQKAYQAILRDADAALGPTCSAWGRLKVNRVHRVRRLQDAALYVGRTLNSPLHDMTPDGRVEPGAFAAPSTLALDRWMPSCMTAYQAEVECLEPLSQSKRPNAAGMQRLRAQILAWIRECSQHEKAAQQGMDSTAACMLDGQACTHNRLRKAAASVDPERIAAAAARTKIQLVLSSGLLGHDEVQRIEGERVASGCLDP